MAHRRPYEVLLLARKALGNSGASQTAEGGPAPAAGVCDPTPGGPAPPDPNPVPDKLVLVACPQVHSRKPQLGPALAPLLPPQPRCLEVSPYFTTHLHTLCEEMTGCIACSDFHNTTMKFKGQSISMQIAIKC